MRFQPQARPPFANAANPGKLLKVDQLAFAIEPRAAQRHQRHVTSSLRFRDTPAKPHLNNQPPQNPFSYVNDRKLSPPA